MRQSKVSLKIWVILSVGNNKGEPLKCYYSVEIINHKMSNSTTQFVSVNFAEFLLDSANNGNEILAVLDDIAEGADTAL